MNRLVNRVAPVVLALAAVRAGVTGAASAGVPAQAFGMGSAPTQRRVLFSV